MRRIIHRAFNFLRRPKQLLSHVIGKGNPSSQNADPREALFCTYSERAQRQGFNRLYVLLSFDCDTPDDIPAAEFVFNWLSSRGIKSAFCVPGALLQQGATTFQKMHEEGAEFLNHGGRLHTEWRDGRYWSTYFYNQISLEEARKDIQEGHKIYRHILGEKPVGFRTPHFGCFQSDEQRAFLYSVLKDLGYQYSSSTIPEFGFNHGAYYIEDGIAEISLSGSYSTPFSTFDSWNCVEDPYNPILTDKYTRIFMETIDSLLSSNVKGILNYYVDPAHVFRSDAFFNALEYSIKCKIPSLGFQDVLEVIKKYG